MAKESLRTIKKQVKDALTKKPKGLSVRQLYEQIKPKKQLIIEKALLRLMDTDEVRLDRINSRGAEIYTIVEKNAIAYKKGKIELTG